MKYMPVPSVSLTSQDVSFPETTTGFNLKGSPTKMQVEACVQAPESAVFDNISHCLESPLILIARRNLLTLRLGAVLLVGQEDRDLSTQFGQLKGA